MTSTSAYFVTCDRCHAPVVSVTRDTQCPRCGVGIRIEWPVRPTGVKTL